MTMCGNDDNFNYGNSYNDRNSDGKCVFYGSLRLFTHVDGDGNRIPTFFVIPLAATTVKYFVTLPAHIAKHAE